MPTIRSSQAEGIGYRLTASVGVATLPEAARTPEDLLAAADAAMYRVKARGKDGIELAGIGRVPGREAVEPENRMNRANSRNCRIT